MGHCLITVIGWEGAESGTSQKTCHCNIDLTTCGDMGWQVLDGDSGYFPDFLQHFATVEDLRNLNNGDADASSFKDSTKAPFCGNIHSMHL